MSLKENVRSFGPAYAALLGISALATLGSVLTLVPNPGASWPNVIGYKSLCTFAPGATFGCALAAAIACVLRARLVKRSAGPAFVPVAVIGLLAILLGVSTFAWAGEKAKWTAEAVSGASEAE